jgi:hypothetical protein
MPSEDEQRVSNLIQRAEVHMFQAEMTPQGGDREIMLHEAQDALFEAECLDPGSGSWHLACLSAQRGSTALCRKWFIRAHEREALPSAEQVANEPRMRAVRQEPWFRAILDDLD